MNSKIPANLDPKLKETYERVMGTSFTPTTPPAQTRPVQTTVVQEPQSPIAAQPVTSISQPIDVANPDPEMVSSPQMPKIGDPFKETESPPANIIPKGTTLKKKSFTPVLLVVGGLIFFVAYAVIWAKVFGLF
jgi:hypothetical protein